MPESLELSGRRPIDKANQKRIEEQPAQRKTAKFATVRCFAGHGNHHPSVDDQELVHRFLNERGFLDIYILTIFALFVVILFGLLGATIVAVRKNAVETFMYLHEAGEFAVRSANMSGIITDATSQDAALPRVEQYFEAGFSNLTNTTFAGDQFAGATYPGPISLGYIDPESAGDHLPDGSMTSQPGYLIGIDVPVLNEAKLPLIGKEFTGNLDVSMWYFATLHSISNS
jgi:hypothetical protein